MGTVAASLVPWAVQRGTIAESTGSRWAHNVGTPAASCNPTTLARRYLLTCDKWAHEVSTPGARKGDTGDTWAHK